jgi:hypothetical protein
MERVALKGTGGETVTPTPACAWCGESFAAVTRGDQRKVFCSTACRMDFHRTARRWAEHMFFSGKVSASDLHCPFPAVYGATTRA